MGTNYYLEHKGKCRHCGYESATVSRHIGKSSTGWVFALHVDDEFTSLEDYRSAWSKPGAVIRNEYSETITPTEMEAVITERKWPHGELRRSRVDGDHCVGNGDGTWDLFRGEFR